MNYSTKSRGDGLDGGDDVVIGAGVVSNLLTERQFIESEKSQVEKLDLLVRNVADMIHHTDTGTTYTTGHELDYGELKYLGF